MIFFHCIIFTPQRSNFFLGAHVEGPFINPDRKGAHNPSLITTPKCNGVTGVTDIYGSLENAAMVTIAPEIEGALDVISDFVDNHVTVSLGKYFLILVH